MVRYQFDTALLYVSEFSFNSTLNYFLHSVSSFFSSRSVEYKYVSEISQETSWKHLCLWSGKKLLLKDSHNYDIFHNAVEKNT